MRTIRRAASLLLLLALAVVVAACGREEGGGGGGGGGGGAAPGITDKEIKLGGSYPFSGPASAYASIGKGAVTAFNAQNAKGGVQGRKINFITLDDAYEPPKAVANTRRLIQQEQVFALFNTLGTPNNLAIWDFVNQQKVPHVYVATGSTAWGADISKHPWTTGWQPNYQTEAAIYAEYLKREKPDAKVAVLYQNDGFGKDLLAGFEKALGGGNVKIVARESYEVTDPTVEPQVSKLAASDADAFLNITTPKFSAQAIGAIAKSDWKPLHILNNVGASKTLVLKPAGLQNAKGIISTGYFKDPEDPQWQNDQAMQQYKSDVKQFGGGADPNESFVAYGYAVGQTMIKALENMKEPTRDGLMQAVRNMDEEIPLLLPGIKVTMNGEQDTYPIEAMQIMQFNGENWELQGEVIEKTVKPGG